MKIKNITFQSSTGLQNINGKIYYNEKTTKHTGVIQVVHGMWEHTDRYKDFAEYFVNNGYIVAVHDHLGHGNSVNENTQYGHFCDKNGNKHLIKDLYKFTNIIKKLYPELPYFMYAHSMGGIIAINTLSVYNIDLDGLILLGSHLNQPSNYLFYSIVKPLSLFVKGNRPAKTITILQHLMFSLNFMFSKEGKSWINRNSEYVKNSDFNDPDPYFFTYSAYLDIFRLSFKATPKSLAKNLKKDTPIYLMTGGKDPVTNGTKLTRKKYKYLLKNDFTQVSYTEYKDARHNLILEPNRDEVLYDILCFFDKTLNIYDL